MIRVAQVSAYGPEEVSGINAVIAVLASELVSSQIECTLVCPGRDQSRAGPKAILLPIRLKRGRNVELAIRTFAMILRRRRAFDLVHAHQAHLQTVAALIAARIIGVPGIVTFHVRVPERGILESGKTLLLARAAAKLARVPVVVSRYVATSLGVLRSRTIPNGVRVSPHPLALRRTSSPEGSLDLVFVGRVTRTKGAFVLLEALSKAARELPAVHLTTFGPIDDLDGYRRAKDSLGVSVRVEDRGFDADWQGTLSEGQVFVLPSCYEGLPVALLEAMSNGLPPIATPVGAVPDVVVEKETGLLVPVGDADRLAEAIVWIGKNRGQLRKMGSAARRLVESRFSAGSMAQAYLDLYRSVIPQREVRRNREVPDRPSSTSRGS